MFDWLNPHHSHLLVCFVVFCFFLSFFKVISVTLLISTIKINMPQNSVKLILFFGLLRCNIRVIEIVGSDIDVGFDIIDIHCIGQIGFLMILC